MISVVVAVSLLLLGWCVPASAQEPESPKYELTIVRVEPVAPVAVADTPGWRFKTTRTNVPAERLAESFKDFMESMGRVFQAAPNALGDSTGKVQLIAGGSIGAVAGIKVTFKRQAKDATSAKVERR
jgi:hypothetical protein